MGSSNSQVVRGFHPLVLSIFPLGIICKIIQYTLMGPKFFIDSSLILYIMKNSPSFVWGPDSFNNAAVFSNLINIWGLDTLLSWSIFYAVIFNIIFFIIVKKYTIRTLSHWIWFWGTIGLINIFMLNLSKEIFQVCIFLLVYLILQSGIKTCFKVILSAAIVFFWGLIFRLYYCLIAAYVVMVYALLKIFVPKRLYYMFLLFFIGVLGSFVLLRFITPNNYEMMAFIRSVTTSTLPDTASMIVDIIPNNKNLLIFCVNVFISMIRLMLPIELLLIKGLKISYFFTIVYQLIVTNYYLKTAIGVLRKQASEIQKSAFCVFNGFLITSAIFEPDFGSWTRHESAIYPIMILMFLIRKKTEIN